MTDSKQDYALPNQANGLLLAGLISELETFLQANRNRSVERNPILVHCAAVRDTRVLAARGFAKPEQLATMERLAAQLPRCDP